MLYNSTLLDRVENKHVIELVLGTLSITNNTFFKNQDYAIYWVYSTLEILNLILDETQWSEDMILVSESRLRIESLYATSISPTTESHNFIGISYSDFNISDINYHNSSLELMAVIFSTGNIENISGSNITDLVNSTISLDYGLLIRSATIHMFDDIHFDNIALSESSFIVIINSNLYSFKNHSISNFNFVLYTLKYTNIYDGKRISVMNGASAFDILNSNMNLALSHFSILNSTISSALYSKSSNISISNSTFDSNTAKQGAAISLLWDSDQSCVSSITGWSFTNNHADVKGGAIYYDNSRPKMSNNSFSNNSADYGPNIASIPYKIIEQETFNDQIYLNDIPSGLEYNSSIRVMLVDQEGQVMNLENDVVAKIRTSSPESKITGVDSVIFTRGLAEIDKVTFIYRPGATNILFDISKTTSNTQIQSMPIHVSFRYCKPGEIIINNQCSKWSYGTYSLDWNSTQWKSWIDKADWLGDTQISVDSGYWRRTTNSTTVIECIKEEACQGGYEPDNEYPVKCSKGYKGVLWTSCEFVDGHKYQLLSNFEWAKCPDPVLNVIRVSGLILIVLLFLAIIIIVNIRKKSENQFSILLRIFTNYLHMVSLSMLFEADIPSAFTSVFTQFEKIGSPNETLFSFDCFIEDYDIKAFSPSNLLFKSFLLALLPLMLMALVLLILLMLKCFTCIALKDKSYDFMRYMVVSIICIIFLLHPSLTLESLRLFQWVEIDDGVYRMRQHMDYDWYSSDHLIWAFAIGFPILVVWVIGFPLIALVILIKYRAKLETLVIKKYLLLLYQGLNPSWFYWEYVNTLRKFLMLWWIVFSTSLSKDSRIMTGTIIVLIILRIQIYLQPYKDEQNNKIEIQGTLAGMFTLFCGIIFIEKEDTIKHFNIFMAILMFMFNLSFIMSWTYLFIVSWNIKNVTFNKMLSLFGMLLCKKTNLTISLNIDSDKKSELYYFVFYWVNHLKSKRKLIFYLFSF